MSEMKAYAYHTHYEIENYAPGKCYPAESALRYWNDDKYAYECYYIEKDGKLYLPRGLDPEIVARSTRHPVEYVRNCNPYAKISFSMKTPPRNETQKEAVRFLTGRDDYNYTKKSSQLVLSLVGGGGKTYCSIAALSVLETKMFVVCHTTDIKDQWESRIKEYTNIQDDAIVKIESSKQMLKYLNPDRKLKRTMANHIIYLTTHSLMQTFIDEQGFEAINQIFINLGIGIKVIDEFHRNFKNTLLIDYATNVYKTFYLSATAGRTSPQEDLIFQASFNQIYKLKRTAEDMNQTSTTFAIYNIFRSNLLPFDVDTMYNRKRFSIHKYIMAEIEDGTIIKKTLMWLYHFYNPENRMYVEKGQLILVLSSTKESCDILANCIQHDFPDKKVISYYSGNKVERVWENDIVCATLSMMGTGNDYPNLKVIINLEAYGSAITADQLTHRLMRGNNIGATYLVELVDGVVPNARALLRKRRPIIDSFVTKSIEMNEYKRRDK